MTNLEILTAVLGAASLLMPVAYFVSKRTKNSVDDAVVRWADRLLGIVRTLLGRGGK
jgi:hypothetical protein